MKKIPETQEEWIRYGNIKAGARKRIIPVVEIPLENIELMWEYEYQAKHYKNDYEIEVLASNSLNNLKREVKNRKWKYAFLSTSKGCFSHGQYAVDEYKYIPKY